MAPDVLAEESHDIIGTSCEIIPGEWYKACFTEEYLTCFPHVAMWMDMDMDGGVLPNKYGYCQSVNVVMVFRLAFHKCYSTVFASLLSIHSISGEARPITSCYATNSSCHHLPTIDFSCKSYPTITAKKLSKDTNLNFYHTGPCDILGGACWTALLSFCWACQACPAALTSTCRVCTIARISIQWHCPYIRFKDLSYQICSLFGVIALNIFVVRCLTKRFILLPNTWKKCKIMQTQTRYFTMINLCKRLR